MVAPQASVRQRSLKEYGQLMAIGVCMGAADVIPGVSGGTMAFILGIYEEWLDAIRAVNLTFIRRLLTLRWREAWVDVPWRFLLVLGLGIGVAIFTLAKGLSWALHHHPTLVWGFFFGLVLASVVIVRQRVVRWTVRTIAAAGLAMVGVYVLVGLAPAATPSAPWFLFLSGAIAICAMILPGISGAFILVLLGQYRDILQAIVTRDVVTLGIFAAGCAIGIVSIARLLLWLFRYYHDITIAVLTGLMLGSLRKVWPWKETLATMQNRHGELIPIQELNVLPAAFTAEVWAVGLLAVGGFGLVFLISYLASLGQPTASA